MSLNKGVVLVTNRKSDSVTNQILRKDGLSIEKLDKLSYCSKLGINLKKNLHYFDKKSLLKEVVQINEWYDSCDLLYNIATDYRVKSVQSAFLKYERYFPDHQTRKVFDDLLGFRTLCDDYEVILELKNLNISVLLICQMEKHLMMDIEACMYIIRQVIIIIL